MAILVIADHDNAVLKAATLNTVTAAAKRIGEARGLGERGYRLAFHCGPEGGQVVYHLHLHFLAGRREERKVERR